MDKRIALIGIILDNKNEVPALNSLLHQYSDYIVGRMGIPNAKENISVISIVIDAPMKVISSLSGKLGMLKGISVKTIYSKLSPNEEEK